MFQKSFTFLINIPVILIAFSLGLFLPDLSKSNTLFGISICSDKSNASLIKYLKCQYKKIYLFICGIYTILLILIFHSFTWYYILLPGFVILIMLMDFTYSIMYRKVKNLDLLKNRSVIGNNIIISDKTKHSAKNNTISSGWFLIPACIAIFDLIISLAIYPSLPVNLAVNHILGVKNIRWFHKSIKSIIKLPIIEGTLTVLLYITYKFISKIHLSYKNTNTELSQKKNRLFCILWSFFIVICSIILNIMLMMSHFNTFIFIDSSSMHILNSILVCTLFLLLTITIVLTSESHLNVKLLKYFDEDKELNTLIDRNDDEYWKFGNCYFNPHDPAVWINKRVGNGKCLNFGKPASYMIISVPVSIFVIIFSLLLIYKI